MVQEKEVEQPASTPTKPVPSPSPAKPTKENEDSQGVYVATHGIPKRNPIKCSYKCPANCKIVCSS